MTKVHLPIQKIMGVQESWHNPLWLPQIPLWGIAAPSAGEDLVGSVHTADLSHLIRCCRDSRKIRLCGCVTKTPVVSAMGSLTTCARSRWTQSGEVHFLCAEWVLSSGSIDPAHLQCQYPLLYIPTPGAAAFPLQSLAIHFLCFTFKGTLLIYFATHAVGESGWWDYVLLC